MISEFEGKGRGLVAARDFEKGELIFEDPAVINVREISPPNGEWVNRIVINAIKKQMADMSEKEKEDFYKLPQEDRDTRGCSLQTVNELGIRENFLVELKIFLRNKIDGMIFLNKTLTNNPCSPNAVKGKLVKTPGGDSRQRIEVRATRNISKGEEVTTFYIMKGTTVNMLRPEIRALLKTTFGFDCTCQICTGEIPDQDDLKRKILKIIEFAPPAHDLKRPSDWRREANECERIMVLTKQMHVVPFDTKCFVCIDLAYAAHMARDPVLRKKAMHGRP